MRLSKFVIFILPVIFFISPILPQEVNWKSLPKILKQINPPKFPKKEFSILKYGAAADGQTDCTEAFQKAIEACFNAGGGKVVVPRGIFLTGAIHLKSNVNLFVSKGAEIRFSSDKSKYLPVVLTRFESVECMNYSPLIYAYGEKNIAITGEGILNGQGSNANWWSWCGKKDFGWLEGMPKQKTDRDSLLAMAERNVPVEQRIFGDGHYLRPNFVQPYNCKNILVEGVTFKDSPMWFLNPVLCENITVKNVKIIGLGPNNDGCNPECSKNVLIKNCYFNNGDDCIAIKSGRNADGRRVNVPSENIVIQNCTMNDGHGGVVMGSEVTGGVRNVFAENCKMDSPNLDRAIRFKTNSIRGGTVENIFVRNIEVGQVGDAVLKIDFTYEEGDKGAFTPTVRNITLENVHAKKAPYAIWIKAYERSPIKNLVLKNCVFEQMQNENLMEYVDAPVFRNVVINGIPLK